MRTNGAESVKGNFVVTEMILFESGRYNERFLRSLKMGSINDDVVDRLVDEMNRTGGQGFSASSITSSRTPIINLEEEVNRDRDYIELAGGWGNKHFCVLMKIVEEPASNYHKPRTYLISGYTDRMAHSQYTKTLPDDLDFYINSILETSNERSSNNCQLFSSVNNQSSNEQLYMMRPQDVLSRYSFNSARSKDDRDSSYRGDMVRDRAIYQSSRTNNIGSNYLSKTLTGIHKNRLELMGEAMTKDRYDDGDNPMRSLLRDDEDVGSRRSLSRATEFEDEVERFRNVVAEESSEEYEFIRSIKSAARDTNNVGAFTFRQLKRIVPDIESVISVNTLDNSSTSRTGLSNRDMERVGDMDGSRFGNSTQEEIIATNIFNAFATVATSCFILMVDMVFALKYDNDTNRYTWDYEIGYEDRGRIEDGSVLFLSDVSDAKQRDLIERMGEILIDSVLQAYSRYGYEILVSIQFNANREMFVSVAIDTDRAEEFCSAIFCDSLTPPVLSNTERRGANLGQSASYLYNEIYKAIAR